MQQFKASRIRLFFLAIIILISPCFAFSQNPEDTCVVVYGDTRTNHEIHKIITNNITRINPVAVFHTGDLVFNGKKKSDWQVFMQIADPLLKTGRFYGAYGNHELKDPGMPQRFSLPGNGKWYDVKVAGIYFMVIDNFSNYKTGSEQLVWLENSLIKSQDESFRVIIMHLPVYSSGWHRSQSKKIRKYLIPLFNKYKVHAVFSGHNHCYEKAFEGKTYYITTAGGGAPLYPKVRNIPQSQLYIKTYNFCKLISENDRIKISVIDTAMKIIDEFYISKE